MMDCIEVQETLSEAADGRPIALERLAQAHTHCDGCAQCAAFARGLELLSSVRAPIAPRGLVQSIIEQVAAERTDVPVVTTPATHQEADRLVAAPARGRDLRPSWWAPRLTVFATAAVFMLAALTLSTIGFFGGARQFTADKSGETLATADQEAGQDRLMESAPAPDAAATGAAVDAPTYISVNGRVYVPVGGSSDQSSSLLTIGPVASAALPATPTVYAYDSVAGDGSIVVDDPGAGWLTYVPVVRRYAGSEYQLVTGLPISPTNVWPNLPSAYPNPTRPDGSPTFRFFGYDESRVKVYVPTAGTARDGFAVAPGTTADDPAAGNPSWTWWAPLQ